MKISRFLDQPLLDSRFPLPLDAPFTAGLARTQGLDGRQLAQLCAAGLLRRPIRNVYVATQAGDSIGLRAACLGLVVPQDCVICDRHAGWLHGAEMVLAPNDHLHVPKISMFRPSGHGRLRNDLATSGERNFAAADIVEVHGLPVTSEIRTAWDLGRLLRRDQAFAALDAMLRLGRFPHEALLAGLPRFRGMRGVIQLRALAPLADARAESPGESVLRLRWLDTGLPAPRPQVPVFRNGRVCAWLDLGVEAVRFAVEYDGLEWHSSAAQRAHDRERRGWLDKEEGWTIRPVGATNVFGLRRDIEEILHEGFAEARRRTGLRIHY